MSRFPGDASFILHLLPYAFVVGIIVGVLRWWGWL